MSSQTKVYINGRLIGFHSNPDLLKKQLIAKRRSGEMPFEINIAMHDDTNEIYINTDAGRVQRPLIVVENGKPKLTEKHLEQIKSGEISFEDLMNNGVIEFLDTEEEENAYVALKEEELTLEHTHLEIDPLNIFSLITTLIPFMQHNLGTRGIHGAKMIPQGIGLASANYNLHTTTEGYLLYYPERSLTKTITTDIIKYNRRPQSQNVVLVIMSFHGFNMMDSMIVNKGTIDRGMLRASYYRTYEAEEKRYPGGQVDRFEVPDPEIDGYLGEDAYKHLGEDGLVEVESTVTEKDVLVGRSSPPRFLEEISEFGIVKEKRRENSVVVRKGKPGYVDKVYVTESINGHKLTKIKVRSEMITEVGDKLTSRHGQKGVVGAVIAEEDMPFTSYGLRPDIIMNPHSVPSRMTVGHLIEMMAGKNACMDGKTVDGTAFTPVSIDQLKKMLVENGFRSDGKEVFYDGTTGKKIKGEIYTGVIEYRKLVHMVAHKVQARARGPVQLLTRQPTEGKAKEGGLRFGEMEGEALVGHGAAMLLQEKLIEGADKVEELVCEKCGLIAVNDKIRNRQHCPSCGSTKVYPIKMTYVFKVLLYELMALGIYPKLVIKDKV